MWVIAFSPITNSPLLKNLLVPIPAATYSSVHVNGYVLHEKELKTKTKTK